MQRLRRFIGFDLADQALLLKALILVIIVRLGLWLLPFRVLRRFLDRISSGPSPVRPTTQDFSEKAAWAVTAASRYVPGARKCLVQALAVQVLLRRRELPAELRIGVFKDEGGKLQAHAWVESRGVVVIGEKEMERYTPLKPAVGDEVLSPAEGAARPAERSSAKPPQRSGEDDADLTVGS